MRTFSSFVTFLFATVLVTAQQPPKITATASVVGKVFAITNGGDVKPALLAHVYLIPNKEPTRDSILWLITDKDKLDAKLTAIAVNAGKPHMADGDILQSCHDLLHDVDEQAASSFKIQLFPASPTYATNTDETGVFNLVHIRPGDYLLVIRGQAGSNDVLWVESLTVVKGVNTFKVSSVIRGCPREK